MTTLSYGKDTFKFEEVSGSLLSYNKKSKVASNESQALVIKNRDRRRLKSRGKDYVCYHCGK